MARSKSNVLDDIAKITALFPWWVGVVLAIVGYAILHWIAGMELAAAKDLRGFGGIAAGAVLKGLATFGQYVVPVACLVGAGMSAYGRRKREALHSRVASAEDSAILQDMNWREFEMLVGEAFRRKGFTVRETGGSGPDGGVDLELSAGTEKYLVQCKQWRARKIDVNVVRELYGVMVATDASGGFVASSGEFTKAAAEFAQGRNIELIDKSQLLAWIQEARQGLGDTNKPVATPSDTAKSKVPACPLCGSAMIQRVAKRGINAGGSFWGCSTYPRCRGTLPTN